MTHEPRIAIMPDREGNTPPGNRLCIRCRCSRLIKSFVLSQHVANGIGTARTDDNVRRAMPKVIVSRGKIEIAQLCLGV